jgi:preprotein translocase subunit SecF
MHIFKGTNFDFLRWRWHAIILSWVVILAGGFAIWSRGIPMGVDFAGGTVVIAQFEQSVSIEQVRTALDRSFQGGDTVVQSYGDASQNQVMMRVPQVGAEQGGALSSMQTQIESALKQGNMPAFKVVGSEIVGPVVGQELRTRGFWATVLSLVGLLLYIGLRFQFSFGVGAVVATIHDLLITLAFLAFFRYDMSLNVIAAILTITGFSTNDTIVIFDRIRENLRSHRRDALEGLTTDLDAFAHLRHAYQVASVDVAVGRALGGGRDAGLLESRAMADAGSSFGPVPAPLLNPIWLMTRAIGIS